ncbi:1,4-alpha-glucan branching protein GlgB [Serinibacter arcticus]|uniref:1,4-alpha-glucan branching enzyme GlgB n=1 Tax=Serinibacter arcticus TaxID=1655435 RepID=A0A4Z1E2E1_9MICO|nr:1,4-alpha-glucan branching protein GlgB [Serinibacter arcticus]TGO03997.1 1,4-alpha-glucan (glycogen) branching enzyme, GH-13-type [Serinibacter arcticus]
MAEVHRTTMEPSRIELLTAWMPQQRWYAAKGSTPSLRIVGGYRLDDPAGEVGVHVAIVADDSGPAPVVYQVPLTYRGAEAPELAHALVGTTEHGVLGTRWVYDGAHDPVFAATFLDLLTSRAHAQSPSLSDTPEPRVAGHTPGDASHLRLSSHAVLSGEQSNTSLICSLVSDPTGTVMPPVMVKLFRVLAAGDNPDVVVAGTLSGAGSPYVPAVFGHVSGVWTDPSVAPDDSDDGDAPVLAGHLAFAQEFLPGVEDAWRVASRAAAAGEDFTGAARELGVATAGIHRGLAESLGTLPTGELEQERLVAGIRARASAAVAEVPALATHRDAVDAALTELAELRTWPPLQRVHGDYHLGQVLHAGDRWLAIDFEGEPLRPLAERTLPDLALRDVAGMLRSFDYAGGSAEQAGGDSARAWVAAAREAFLGGYSGAAGIDVEETHGPLLRALELDKALYEAVYEHRNRPDWLGIPLAALRRLLAPAEESARHHGSEDDLGSAPHPIDGADMPVSESRPPQPQPVDHAILGAIGRGEHPLPHDVLGAHVLDGVVTFRTRRPLAESVTYRVLQADGDVVDVPAEHELDGTWVAAVASETVPDYRIEVVYDGAASVVDDPYRFLPTLGDVDRHLLAEGRHERLWEVLGAHVRTFPSALGEVRGASFAVWAPNASAVRVIGDFNGWDGPSGSMRSLGSTGVWEIFVPDAGEGSRYKYEIRYADGSWHQKADPMARATEVPPSTASVVAHDSYDWEDGAWMTARAASDPHSGPMSIYELHLGSWKKDLTYVDAADQLVEYLTWLNFTHVELMPLAEHPFGGSWGYQVTSYYAPTSRFGSPDELRYLIDRLHQAGIGVLLDWVPAHFPKDSWALANFDGTPLYEHPDPRRGEQKDWGTHVFNFGRTEVRNFLVANAAYWLQEFHVDGLRVDAVASMLYLDYSREAGEWLPNVYGGRENLEAISLLQEANAVAYRVAPGSVMIAEESTSFPGVTTPTSAGGLGFGLKWNMGWMNDTLHYLSEDPINRRYHHGELTFSLVYAFSEQFLLPLSHDEVVHGKGSLYGKMPGDHRQKLAGVRGLLSYQWSHPGKQLIFMGQEFAQSAEWNEERGLDWWHMDDGGHRGVAELVRRLNEVYRDHPALWADDFSPAGYQWLDANDGDHNVLAYLRTDGDDVVVVVQSFSGETHEGYRVGLPFGGRWTEILNTDAELYGGHGVGNLGVVEAVEEPYHGRSHSATLRVPALGAVWLTPER